MSIEDSAKVILAGEHSRRRGYLTSVIANMGGLAIMGTLSIWAFLVKWDILFENTPNTWDMFSTRIAWASALSSVLIGLWRFYVRSLDSSIIQLYPAIYMCERMLLPEEICTIKPPTKVQSLSKNDVASENLGWVTVCNKDFEGRGHNVIDWLAVILIIIFGVISIVVAYSQEVIKIGGSGTLHPIRLLLFGNIIGLLLILFGWLLWKGKKINWPIPGCCVSSQADCLPEYKK
jgi:hypothetical protein